MNVHLSHDQIAGYCSRTLAAVERLTVSDHLVECEACRRRLAEAMAPAASPADTWRAVQEQLRRPDEPDPTHLSEEELVRYVFRETDDIDREVIEAHLHLCPGCAAEVQGLREFQALMSTYPAQRYCPAPRVTLWDRLRSLMGRPGVWLTLEAVGAAAAAVAVMNVTRVQLYRVSQNSVPRALYQRELQEANGKLEAANRGRVHWERLARVTDQQNQRLRARLQSQPGTPRALTPGGAPKRGPRLAWTSPAPPGVPITRNGGGAEVASEPHGVEMALRRGFVGMPAKLMAALNPPSPVTMSGTEERPAFKLQAPVGLVVITDRPLFTWQPLDGAVRYQVEVLDVTDGDKNAQSVYQTPAQGVTIPQWQPPRPLPRGRTYEWGVRAVGAGHEEKSAPVARFRVLEQAKLDQLVQSLVTAGVLYAQAGLPDDAERTFRQVAGVKSGSPPGYHDPALHTVEVRDNRQDALPRPGYLGQVNPSMGQNPAVLAEYQRALARAVALGSQHEIAASLNNLGDVYYSLGRYPRAQEQYQRALPIFETLDERREIARTLDKLGGVYEHLAQAEKARDYLQRALALHEALGDRQGVAVSLASLSIAYFVEGQYAQALEYYQRALPLFEKLGNLQEVAAGLNNLGQISHRMGQYAQALEYHQKALALREKLGNQQQIAQSLSNLGNVYMGMERYQEALEPHQQALALYEKLGGRQEIARTLDELGGVYEHLGQAEKAREHLQRALALHEALGDRQGVAVSLASLSIAYFVEGQYAQALEYYQRALPLFEKLGNLQEVAAGLNNLGQISHRMGQYAQALEYHQKALALREKLGNQQQIAQSLSNLGNVYMGMERYQEALEHHQRALVLYEKLGNRQEIAQGLNNLGIICARLGQYSPARADFQRALPIFESLGDRTGIAASLDNLGNVYDGLGQHAQALDHYQQACALRETHEQRAPAARLRVSKPAKAGQLVHTLLTAGVQYAQAGLPDEAEEAFRQALAVKPDSAVAQKLLASVREQRQRRL